MPRVPGAFSYLLIIDDSRIAIVCMSTDMETPCFMSSINGSTSIKYSTSSLPHGKNVSTYSVQGPYIIVMNRAPMFSFKLEVFTGNVSIYPE